MISRLNEENSRPHFEFPVPYFRYGTYLHTVALDRLVEPVLPMEAKRLLHCQKTPQFSIV